MERWRAVAMCIGEISNVVTRAEKARADLVETTPLRDEDKPPRLVADQQRPPAIDPDMLEAIEAKIAQLNERMDAYERMRKAEDALLELEDRIAAELPPDDDDGDERTLN
jgi:hypothetical protein